MNTVYVGGPGHGLRVLPAGLPPSDLTPDGAYAYGLFNSFFTSARGAWPAGPFWAPGVNLAADLGVYVSNREFATPADGLCCGRGGTLPIRYTQTLPAYAGPGDAGPVFDATGTLVTPPTAGWIAWWNAWTAIVDLGSPLAQADALRARIASYL